MYASKTDTQKYFIVLNFNKYFSCILSFIIVFYTFKSHFTTEVISIICFIFNR